MFLNLVFVYCLMPIESISFAPHELFLMHEPIQNNLFGYGQYCGPGPDESLWPLLQPIDEFDQACQRHDDDYRICYETLNDELGYSLPKFIHQIMAMRGILPLGPLRRWLLSKSMDRYLVCMHNADKRFAQLLEARYESNEYPGWWKNTAKAPARIEGVEGYEEACTFGIRSLGYCLMSSKSFFRIVKSIFHLSVASDLPYLSSSIVSGA